MTGQERDYNGGSESEDTEEVDSGGREGGGGGDRQLQAEESKAAQLETRLVPWPPAAGHHHIERILFIILCHVTVNPNHCLSHCSHPVGG